MERHVKDPFVESLGERKPRLQEDVHHRQVVAENVGVERLHAALPRQFREPLEHARPESVPLQGIGNRERHFGPLGPHRVAVVAGDSAQPPRPLGDDDHVPGIVDGRDPGGLGEIEVRNRHEAVVQAALRESTEQAEHRDGVVGSDRAEAEGRAVPEDDVRLDVGGIENCSHASDQSTQQATTKSLDFPVVFDLSPSCCRIFGGGIRLRWHAGCNDQRRR